MRSNKCHLVIFHAPKNNSHNIRNLAYNNDNDHIDNSKYIDDQFHTLKICEVISMSQPDCFDRSMHLYRSLLRTARSLRKELSKPLIEQGLTGSQYVVLEAVTDGGVSLGHLAKQVNRDPSNITGIVDRLERAGLIVRGKDPNDRRVIIVFLTPAGKAVQQKISAVHPAAVHDQMQVLTFAEQTQLMEMLKKLNLTKTERGSS